MSTISVVLTFCLLSLLLLPTCILGRHVSGSFQLSGDHTEHVLAKFALSAYARGLLNVTITSNDMYEDESYLRVHVYIDTDWVQWQKRPLCESKIQLTKQTMPITFDFTRLPDKELWSAFLSTNLKSESETRPHYWYIVVDDCSLERHNHNARIPRLHYEVQLMNDVGGGKKPDSIVLTHFSADEVNQINLHTATLILSSILTFLLLLHTLTSTTIHAATLLVMAATACDAASSICELLHLRMYAQNGYGWYLMDATSSHFEAICDSFVVIVLLALASGWTLAFPSQQQHGSTSIIQRLISGFRNPAGSLLVCSPAGFMVFAIILLHAGLAQWGRIYNDDFTSYHDLEHAPGKVLMGIRCGLGLLFLIATIQTSQTCTTLSVQRFYHVLGMVGTFWFLSLPVMTVMCANVVPYYLRHPVVSTGGAMLQTVSLLLLASLVSSSSKASAFHKASHLQHTAEDSLTDQLSSLATSSGNGTLNNKANPTIWKFGKTKIRLD